MSYVLIKGGQSEVVVKKSRFIGEVFAVNNEEEAAGIVADMKKKYYDARHNCFAYSLDEGKVIKSSDDGEPSGTAGRPILDVITGADVSGALIVVTRYFGGTLLGCGPLSRTYMQSAKEALEDSTISLKMKGYQADIKLSYQMYGKFEYLASTLNINILNTEYKEDVVSTVLIPSENKDAFTKKLTDITGGATKLNLDNEVIYAINEGKVLYF